jgi:hypothetical protein
MSNPTESWGYNPNQEPIQPFVPESQGRIDAFRTSALETARQGLQSATEKGKEGLVNSVESGVAEKVGHRAIDIAAKTAEQSLKTLPPGTRLIGKIIGKRVISRLQDEGHARLGGALDTVATRVDGGPQSPATPDVYSFMPIAETAPTSGWGVPMAETAPRGFDITPETPPGAWGSPIPVSPANPGFGSSWGIETAPAPLGAENPWFTQPNPPVAEIPPAAKEGMFKRLRKKNDLPNLPTAPEVVSTWGPTPETPTGWGASDIQTLGESPWGN